MWTMRISTLYGLSLLVLVEFYLVIQTCHCFYINSLRSHGAVTNLKIGRDGCIFFLIAWLYFWGLHFPFCALGCLCRPWIAMRLGLLWWLVLFCQGVLFLLRFWVSSLGRVLRLGGVCWWLVIILHRWVRIHSFPGQLALCFVRSCWEVFQTIFRILHSLRRFWGARNLIEPITHLNYFRGGYLWAKFCVKINNSDLGLVQI